METNDRGATITATPTYSSNLLFNDGDKDNSFSEPAKTFDRVFASKPFPYFLTILKEHGGNLSFGEYSHYLQDTTGEDWNAISPTITKLCDAGYIYADRKESIYTLTEAGYDYINSTQTPAAETKFADGDTTSTQMPDTVVNEGDNSDEPPADFIPPDYDPFDPFGSEDATNSSVADEAKAKRPTQTIRDSNGRYPEPVRITAQSVFEDPASLLNDGRHRYFPGGLTNVTGKQKSGKTMLCKWDAANLLLQEHIVIYFDTEQNRRWTQQFVWSVNAMVNGDPNQDCPNLYVFNLVGYPIKERRNQIRNLIGLYKPQLAFIDNVKRLLESGDANKPDECSLLTDSLNQLAVETDTCIVPVIHENKRDNEMRGHLGLELSQIAELTQRVEDMGNGIIGISADDTRGEPFDTFYLKLITDKYAVRVKNTDGEGCHDVQVVVLEECDAPPESRTSGDRTEDIKQYIEPVRAILAVKAMTASELEAALMEKGCIKKEGISQRTAQRIMSRLVNAGALKAEKSSRETWYSFNDDYDDDSLSS